MDFYVFSTALGQMAAASENGHALSRLWLPGAPLPRLMPRATPLLTRLAQQVSEFLAGTRRTFSIPLRPTGTPFQLKVWQALCQIPYGQTRSYGDIARIIGCPNGFRAVGSANHANPIPILIPCHRVIASDGTLGGYGGGACLKSALLQLEGASACK